MKKILDDQRCILPCNNDKPILDNLKKARHRIFSNNVNLCDIKHLKLTAVADQANILS